MLLDFTIISTKTGNKHDKAKPLLYYVGNEGLSQWLEDPSYPNSTLSWKIINGEKEKNEV